jgi:hypothetical protein
MVLFNVAKTKGCGLNLVQPVFVAQLLINETFIAGRKELLLFKEDITG